MSNKIVLKHFSGYIIFILLLASLASAFTVESNQEASSMCAATTNLITAVVSGNGQYTVGVSGSGSKWATAVPAGFVISDGGSKSVYTYISPPSDAPAGNYDVEITISDGSSIQFVRKSIQILDCFDVDVGFVSGQNVCPGEDAKYDFNLRNSGEYTQTYDLSVGGNAADWIVLSEETTTLKGGEEETIFAYLKIPLDARGDFEFSLTAQGRLRDSISSAVAQVNVEGCYDYDVRTEKDFYQICDRSTEKVPIKIMNVGTVSNVFNLDLEGPSWGALESDSVVISAGGEGIVNLLLSPDYDTEGEFNFQVSIEDENGEIALGKVIRASVRDCHEVTVVVEEEDNICASLTNSYPVLIRNDGEFSERFKVFVEGPSWADVDVVSVDLDAGAEESINLEISPGFDDAGQFNIDIVVESIDGGIKNSDSISIEVVSEDACYNPEIQLDDSIEVGHEGSVTVPVVIENKGSESAAYEIGISGSAANFVQLNPGVVDLGVNKAETIYLYIAPTLGVDLGRYDIVVSARLEDSAILDSRALNILVVERKEGSFEGITGGAIVDEAVEDVEARVGFFKRIWNFFFGRDEVVEEEIVDEGVEEEIVDEGAEEVIEELEDVNIEELDEVIDEEVIEEIIDEEIVSEEVVDEGIVEEKTSFEGITEEVIEEEITLELEKEPGLISGALSYPGRVWNYVKGDRNRMLIGVIILFALLILFKYRRGILGFFEEEDDEFDEFDDIEEKDEEEVEDVEKDEEEVKKEEKPKKTTKKKK